MRDDGIANELSAKNEPLGVNRFRKVAMGKRLSLGTLSREKIGFDPGPRILELLERSRTASR